MMENIVPLIFGDLDNELNNTRKVLERVPEDKLSWKPHEKSMSLGSLAVHIANLPWFFDLGVRQDGYNFVNFKGHTPLEKTADIVATFDEKAATARAAIADLEAGKLGDKWTLASGDHEIFTIPRVAVLRTFAMSHIIHHRAQLIVYLRLLDVPIPGLYGPSADEQ